MEFLLTPFMLTTVLIVVCLVALVFVVLAEGWEPPASIETDAKAVYVAPEKLWL